VSDAEQIIRQQLAEHGDGARALDAAEATGLPRRTLETVLWALLSGKQRRPLPRIAPTPTDPHARRMGARVPRWCPLCQRQIFDLALHRKRQHPGVDL
jgi:hypothetical protein